MSWELSRASVDDLDAIMAIETSVFETDAWSSAGMRAELASSNTYYVVARPVETPGVPEVGPETGLAGYGGLLCPRGAHEADVQTIAVAPGSRRRGLGRALVLALVGEARRRGAREVFLEVRADNPGAQALYADIGFAELGIRKGYYQPDGVDALVMRLALTDPAPGLATPTDQAPATPTVAQETP